MNGRLKTLGLGMVAALSLVGCADGESRVELADAAEAAPEPVAPARCERARFVDEVGRRWKLRQAEPVKLAEPMPLHQQPWRRKAPPARSLESLSAAELADRMRGVTMKDGCEYVEEQPRLEAAQWAIAHRRQVFDFPGSTGSAPVGDATDEPVTPTATAPQLPGGVIAAIIDGDTREMRSDNTSYPARTQILLSRSGGSCSATLIGPSTAISAAHCFHDGSSWLPDFSWSPGVDSQDTVRFPWDPTPGAPYPSTNSNNKMVSRCYWVTIPSGWTDGGDRDWDYAVIEFDQPGCGLKPGNTVGWLGWGTQSDDTIESNNHYIYGYPGNGPLDRGCGEGDGCYASQAGANGSCFWPKIWGSGGGDLSAWSTTLSYDIDATAGQSGSGVYNFAQGYRKVVGVHVGCQENLFGDYNQARRIDSSAVTFIRDHSQL